MARMGRRVCSSSRVTLTSHQRHSPPSASMRMSPTDDAWRLTGRIARNDRPAQLAKSRLRLLNLYAGGDASSSRSRRLSISQWNNGRRCSHRNAVKMMGRELSAADSMLITPASATWSHRKVALGFDASYMPSCFHASPPFCRSYRLMHTLPLAVLPHVQKDSPWSVNDAPMSSGRAVCFATPMLSLHGRAKSRIRSSGMPITRSTLSSRSAALHVARRRRRAAVLRMCEMTRGRMSSFIVVLFGFVSD